MDPGAACAEICSTRVGASLAGPGRQCRLGAKRLFDLRRQCPAGRVTGKRSREAFALRAVRGRLADPAPAVCVLRERRSPDAALLLFGGSTEQRPRGCMRALPWLSENHHDLRPDTV